MMHKRTRPIVAIVMAVAMLSPTGTVATGASVPTPAEWRPWLLSSADQFRLPPPPGPRSRTTRRELRELRELQEARTAKIKRRIRYWNQGPATVPWTKLALRMIVKWRPRPPFAARSLALLHTGMFDALIASHDSRRAYKRARPASLDQRIRPVIKARGSPYPPEQAVLAGAAAEILGYLFPEEDPRNFTRLARRAAKTRLQAGVNYRSDVSRGLALGRSVASLAIERGESDGHANTGFSNPRPEGEQYWEPTPPGFETPTGGPVGTWRPWLATTPATFRETSGIADPHAYGSDAFMAELREVMDVKDKLTEDQAQTAIFWDDGPGTYTPAGHWTDIGLNLAASHGLGTKQAARVFAYLSVAEADAAISSFEAKYHWWSIRPVTAIRRLCDNATRLCTKEELQATPSLATYPNWDPFIVTPPFPGYPGGHSTFSGAAGSVLAYFFPNNADILTKWAEDAAMSRLYGGIHFRSDNDSGLTLGRTIGQMATARAETDGSGL